MGNECLIILGAGSGRRLGINRPKILAEICNRTILDHQLDAASTAGIKHVILVTGHRSPLVERCLRSMGNYRLKIDICVNNRYRDTGNLFSLALALNDDLKEMDTFYIVNGDVVFQPEILFSLKRSPHPDLIAVDYLRYYLEDMLKVKIDRNGFISELSKKIPSQNAAAASIQLFKLSSQSVLALRDDIGTILTKDKNHILGYALNNLIQSCEYPALAYNVNGSKWWEIDTPEDQALAEVIFAGDSEALRNTYLYNSRGDVHAIESNAIMNATR